MKIQSLMWCSLVILLLSGCSKDAVKPVVGERIIVANPGKTTTTFNVAFELPAQNATMHVKNNKLTIYYDEKVRLLVDPTEYVRSWGLHLKEDFSQSSLNGLDYTTVTQHGHITFKWVDDNLNNVIIKSRADTVIKGITYKKVVVERTFTFTKEYASKQAALDARVTFLNRKADKVIFSSFYYADNNDVAPATGLALIHYIAATNQQDD
jgi:hypothetical protein